MEQSGTQGRRWPRARATVAAGLSALAMVGVVACTAKGLPGPGRPGTPSTTTVPDAPATTLYGTPPLPDQLVAVGEDGVLAVVDRTTGERLAELADGESLGRGRHAIRRVRVSPEGDTAWFDARSRHGGHGRIYRVPTDGSADPVQVASGTYPDVSPSGSQLAFVRNGAVVVQGIVTDEELSWPQTGRITDLAWSIDGGLLWVRNGKELVWLDNVEDAGPQVVATAERGERLSLPVGGRFRDYGPASVLVSRGRHDPAPDAIVLRQGSEPTRNPATFGQQLDRSGHHTGWWSLVVTGGHTIRWSGSGGIGTIATGYTSADW